MSIPRTGQTLLSKRPQRAAFAIACTYHWFAHRFPRNRGAKFFIVPVKQWQLEAMVSAGRSGCTIRSSYLCFPLVQSGEHIDARPIERSLGGRLTITCDDLKVGGAGVERFWKLEKTSARNFVVERGWHLEHTLKRHSPCPCPRVLEPGY